MYRIVRTALRGGLVAVLILLVPIVASAHESRELGGGQYQVEIGFIDEPAFVGEKNGLFFHVGKPSAAGVGTPAPDSGAEGEETPVLGLADTLQAEVIRGAEKLELELRPSFSDPGSYNGYFFPMAEGDYTFRIFGQIEGLSVDETFTSSPEGFSPVNPREPLEFPKAAAAGTDRGVAAATVGGGGGDAGGPSLLRGAVGLVLAAGVGLWLVRRTALGGHRSAAPAPARG